MTDSEGRMTGADSTEDKTRRSVDEDVDDWAERERRRREAWLAGPSESEKRAWVRRRRLVDSTDPLSSGLPPTEEEVDEWADRERRRREEWLRGPTEDEKRAYACRRDFDASEPTTGDVVQQAAQLRRQAYLSRLGALHLLATFPFEARAKLLRAGLDSERALSEPYAQRRVPYERS